MVLVFDGYGLPPLSSFHGMKAKEVQAFFERVACKARVAEQGSN